MPDEKVNLQLGILVRNNKITRPLRSDKSKLE